MRTWLRLTLLLALALVVGCGGSDETPAAGDGRRPRDVLSQLRPISAANVTAVARGTFDNAPPDVGGPIELRLEGPLRNNGADKLPSLDWKIAFSGLATKFTSRIVSTGDNFFINLGGQDFEAGEQAVQQLTDQAQESKQKGLAQVGLNPLAAVRNVEAAGDRKFDGATLKVYKGDIDVDAVLDQIERLSQGLPNAGAAQTIPGGKLTAEQRAQAKRTFAKPRFEAAVADDDTIRQLLVTSTFTTPPANQEAAGGITGGHIEYRVDYTKVGEDTTITPPKNPQPLSDFAQQVQEILSKRG
jgi:hypothetical protein